MDRIYRSKLEIYEDYDIAIKFIPSFPVTDKAKYENLIGQLASDLNGRADLFARAIEGFHGYTTPAHAYFIEQSATDDAGGVIGWRYVLLGHETGLEIFIPPLIGAALKGAAGGAAGWGVKKAFDYLFPKVQQYWTDLISPETERRIIRVAIRTRDKGAMEMAYSDFRPEQIGCLLLKWNGIDHINEVNSDCFGGKLVEPSGGLGPTPADVALSNRLLERKLVVSSRDLDIDQQEVMFKLGSEICVKWHPRKRHGDSEWGRVKQIYRSRNIGCSEDHLCVVFTNDKNGELEIAKLDEDEVNLYR